MLEPFPAQLDIARDGRCPAPAPTGDRRSVLADLREIGADLIRFRELLLQVTLRDVRIRYKQAVMGIGWAVVMPLVVVLSGCVVTLAFAHIGGWTPGGAVLAAIAVKSLGWAFFVGALGFGTASITGNIALVTKVYFPREILPVASVLTQLLDAAIGALVLCVALPLFGVGLSSAVLWVPVLVLLLVMLTTAATLLLSCANVFFRDAKHVVQVVLSFGIFFTPVFFTADALGPHGAWLIMLNPLAPVLEGMRLAIVHGHDLLHPLAHGGVPVWQPWYLAYAAVAGVGGLLASALIFHRAEFVFAEWV
jgi:ABC-type polysaccharide/polyol phosphate export permease